MADFDWDDGNRDHIARHGVTPEEAEQICLGESLDLGSYVESGEERTDLIGETSRGRILHVAITMRRDTIRVVTAFVPGTAVRRAYLEYRVSFYER